MQKKKNLFYLLLALLILAACNRNMSKEELVAYANNPKNGLVQEKTIRGISYKLRYRPIELLVEQHIAAKDSISQQEIEQLRENYNLQQYFMLSISQGKHEALKGAKNFQQFSDLVQKMAFGMGNYITLTTETRDTLNLIDSHFARYYGMGRSNDILLAFENKEVKSQKLTFLLKEFGLKTGDTRFYFHTKDIEKLKKKRIKKN